MALMKPGRSMKRAGSLKGVALLRVQQGRTYAQAWPRKRGLPKQDYQRANLERMRIAQQAVKYVPGREIAPMEDGLREFMANHVGVRGTAAIRLRDWLTQVFYGRAWGLSLPDGTVFYSQRVVRECSDFLDWLDPRPGSLVVRTNVAWLPTVQCKPGRFLQLRGDGPESSACPPASIPTEKETVGGTVE